MTNTTYDGAYIEIDKIIDGGAVSVDGYQLDTDQLTFSTFLSLKRKHEVPFEQAAYLVNLYNNHDDMLDTFPMSEPGYVSLLDHGF